MTQPIIDPADGRRIEHGPGLGGDWTPSRITEVSTTVDTGLAREDLEHLNEAERLGLIVGAAYGQALAERDEARAALERVTVDLGGALALLRQAHPLLEDTSWAKDSSVAGLIQAYLGRVDSEQTPAEEGQTDAP